MHALPFPDLSVQVTRRRSRCVLDPNLALSRHGAMLARLLAPYAELWVGPEHFTILDSALLRPGRFDRQVLVDRPDKRGREQILAIHAREVKLGTDVDLRSIAARTPGFAGADLANVVNEAALLAARRDHVAVLRSDFEEAIERVVAGLEKKNRRISEKEKEIVAHHEAGHAVVNWLVPRA